MSVASIAEQTYISQFASKTLGLVIHINGVPADPDANAVMASMVNDDSNITIFSRAATRIGPGIYQIVTTSADTQAPGDYTLKFTYTISTVPQHFDTYIEVGPSSPAYDNLSAPMQDLVENVWVRFADLFDSDMGGPHLQEYYQTKFGRGRMAQLLTIAVGRLNTIAQPFQTYTLDGNGGPIFPIAQWGPLLSQALYVETIKHLIRSYVEQPEAQNVVVSRLDRRDYQQRWTSFLEIEEADLSSQLSIFKMANMGLGRPAVLVSGGVYGRYAPTRIAGSVAARPRYWSRFY